MRNTFSLSIKKVRAILRGDSEVTNDGSRMKGKNKRQGEREITQRAKARGGQSLAERRVGCVNMIKGPFS